ncbi:unnamed protein product [Polarella glacialis]|uniref:Uncharacterized protein n=1 Tax=Polarella glacialis TaxID=89957 RepID=A0A813I097_POLGL|nr:unnamed protein product [Polarella glacialis]CAE8736172.1 unnamed protein product [Polarella glacialis]
MLASGAAARGFPAMFRRALPTVAAGRSITTATAAESACHEAVRRWVHRAIRIEPVLTLPPKPRPRLSLKGAAEAAKLFSQSQDFLLTQRVFSAIAIGFPLIAIPVMEVRNRRIQDLETKVLEKDLEIDLLRKEVEAARTTKSGAAVCGVIF